MLIFPEILSKEEVEDMNQMAEEVERFFEEKGLPYFSDMHLKDKCRLPSQILVVKLSFCIFDCINPLKQ